MDNRTINRNQTNEAKGKAKAFWKNVGFIVMALFVAVITVFVLNLNR